MSEQSFDLSATPVHLGLGARVIQLEPFDGSMEWYGRYGASTAADGNEGRLVSLHTFTEPWTVWEVHPNGEELVVCVSGEMTLTQQLPGGEVSVTVTAGQAVINPAGVWHTADITGTATALFITAGVGTENRDR